MMRWPTFKRFVTSGYGHLPLTNYVLLQINEAARAQQYLAQLLPRVTTAAPWPTIDGRTETISRECRLTAAGLTAIAPERVRWPFPREFLDGSRLPNALRSSAMSTTVHRTSGSSAVRSTPPVHAIPIVHGASTTDVIANAAFIASSCRRLSVR
jgi:hypothetical protein